MKLSTHIDYRENPFLAAEHLGELLWRGNLRLFLGAGVSKGFGLPEWKTLIARIIKKDNDLDYLEQMKSRSIVELRTEVDAVDSNDETFRTIVYDALYRDVSPNLLDQLSRSPLLLAVAAMTTGVTRGRIESVVTYNYDNLLEQYLEMLGLKVCIRTQHTDLSSRADLELNYVHGRLPQQDSRQVSPSRIILSETSYGDKRSEIDSGWSASLVEGLYSRIGFFLGLSGEDETILDVLRRADKRIHRPGEPYTGYWVLTPDAFTKKEKAIINVGMCPIRLEISEIPQFVLAVCQNAMA